MPRKRVWPPTIHKHKSGQAMVRIRGKDYYLGPYGSETAQKEYLKLLASVSIPQEKKEIPNGSVAEGMELWLREESARLSRQEIDHYRRTIIVLVEVAGSVKLAAFSVSDLERVRREMVARDWCRNVINRRVVRIRTIWRWLERFGHAPRGSYEHLRTLPGLPRHDARVRQTAAVQPASWSDLVRVCRCVRREVRSMLLLQWFTGCRPSEVCRMRACDLDRSGEVWLYTPEGHKNAWRGQSRIIPLGPVCRKILAPWLVKPTTYLFRPSSRCPKRKRDHYTAITYSRVVARAATKAGVSGFHAYRLRHAAKQRLTREQGLDAARAVLGQKSLGTTNQYAEGIDLDTVKRVAKKMG